MSQTTAIVTGLRDLQRNGTTVERSMRAQELTADALEAIRQVLVEMLAQAKLPPK